MNDTHVEFATIAGTGIGRFKKIGEQWQRKWGKGERTGINIYEIFEGRDAGGCAGFMATSSAQYPDLLIANRSLIKLREKLIEAGCELVKKGE